MKNRLIQIFTACSVLVTSSATFAHDGYHADSGLVALIQHAFASEGHMLALLFVAAILSAFTLVAIKSIKKANASSDKKPVAIRIDEEKRDQ